MSEKKMSENKKLAILIIILSVCTTVIVFMAINLLKDDKPSKHGSEKTKETLTKLSDEDTQKKIDVYMEDITTRRKTLASNVDVAKDYEKRTTEMANEVDAIMEQSGIASFDRCIKSSEARNIFELADEFYDMEGTIDEKLDEIKEEPDLEVRYALLKEFKGSDGYLTSTEEVFEKLSDSFEEFEYDHPGRLEAANEKKQKALNGEQ